MTAAAPHPGPSPCDELLEAAVERIEAGAALDLDPDTVAEDLARIVLGLMEFLRQLMELQAIRRMEAGSLTPQEEERLGLTLMRAEEAIAAQARAFGLTPDQLSLDLGPLGRTI
ncbi:gas vesicle protein K [Rhodovulum sp. 12E13]|uniref:gas vesicle protein K n=1 Tax=Rhodovulum sp. 12E13 TaxID=2203891 RepID=UPI000E12C22F|nr:gas vesicle protein K [Rhodovulum sp. 12E13]RDC73188.1 gas vesicle protein K [Rhodovulum sp. 12E13]